MKKMTLNEKMLGYKVLIENSVNNPSVSATMSVFGFSTKKLLEGKVLYEEIENLMIRLGEHYDGHNLVSNTFSLKFHDADDRFSMHIRLARAILRNKAVKFSELLGINHERSGIFSEWINQARQFYGNALASRKLSSFLSRMNITEDTMLEMISDLDDLEQLKIQEEKELGKRPSEYLHLDNLIIKLEQWISEYKAVARIAFEDNFAALESLGMLVHS